MIDIKQLYLIEYNKYLLKRVNQCQTERNMIMIMLKNLRSHSTQKLFPKHILRLFLMTLIFISVVLGETLQTVNFEVDGQYYSTSPAESNDNTDDPDYWIRTNGTTPVIYPNVAFSGMEGSYFFAAEDLDYDGGITPHYVTCDAVSIAGYSNIQVKILVAGRGSGGGKEGEEFLKIQYQYDGGGFTTVSQFLGNGNYYSLDADANGVVDGADINETMSEFTFDLPSSGTSLQIRIYVYCGGGEELAFDDIRVFGVETPLPVELSSFIAENSDGSVLLTWTTESETENQGYMLEKRVLGASDWTELADYQQNVELTGNGTTTETHVYSYTDDQAKAGYSYEYRLGDVDYAGKIIWHEKVSIELPQGVDNIPEIFGLLNAYPNPFNPSVNISYSLENEAQTELSVYDINGNLIETLIKDMISAGTHNLLWQPMNIGTGMYIVRLNADNINSMHKIVYVK